MSAVNWNDLQVGDELPVLTAPTINRTMLALFAGASGDHNPIHIDIDFAKKAGMPDVFAHGMLSMAWLGRFLTNWQPQANLRNFNSRFLSITHLGDKITCSGKITEKLEQDGAQLVKLEIQAANQEGDVKLAGEALVAIN